MRSIHPALLGLALAIGLGIAGCGKQEVAYAGPRILLERFEIRDLKYHYSVGTIKNRDECTNTRVMLEIWRSDNLHHEIQLSESWGPSGSGPAEHRVGAWTRSGPDGHALPTWVSNGDRVRLRSETWIGRGTLESGAVSTGIREYSAWTTLTLPAAHP